MLLLDSISVMSAKVLTKINKKKIEVEVREPRHFLWVLFQLEKFYPFAEEDTSPLPRKKSGEIRVSCKLCYKKISSNSPIRNTLI